MSNLPFTLEQLRTFNTICEEGSFRQAAKKLYISQPAVSLQIQNMERQLNTTLFFRNKQKANLTKSGELFQSYCSKILMLCTETCQAIEERNKSESSALIIGASEPTGTYLMPRLLGIFRHKYPNIELQLTIGSAEQIPWDVANKKIDLAIVGDDMPNELKPSLEITAYAEDEIALILPISHPFASLPSIRKEDLYRLRFIALRNQSATIQRSIENTLTQYGIDSSYFKFEMELNSIEAAKNAVQSGLGAAFVSVSALSKELELKVLHWAKIEGISLKRTLNIITNPDNAKAKKITLLKDKLLKMF